MNVIEAIFKHKIYAVVRTNNAEEAYNIASALIEGGIKIIELPLLCAETLGVIAKLAKIENVYICAGGIITAKHAELAHKFDADLLVSPVFQQSIVKLSQSYNKPVITTVSTANEAYESWKARVPIIKIYPAKHMGGAEYIWDLIRPMPFLNLLPTGNIQLDEVADYLKAGAVAVGIGAAFYRDANSKEEITKRAKYVVDLIKNFENGEK